MERMSQQKRRRSERIWQRKRGRRLERTKHHSIYLGHELLVAILSRLPVKSLLRFMCVNKSWLSLISSPYLISSHLRNSRTDIPQALVHQWGLFINDGRPASIHLSHVELSLDFGFESPHIHLHAIGSAKGLICYYGVQVPHLRLSKFILFNPEIKSFISVPPPLPSIDYMTVIKGFGFDDTTLDYKIILANKNSYVYLYSLNSNSWKFISFQISWRHMAGDCAIFAMDCFHWLNLQNFQEAYMPGTIPDLNPCILVFDIKSETFRRILFPQRPLGWLNIIVGFDESPIGVVQYIGRLRGTRTHVWLMDQNGSWSKIADNVKVADKHSAGKEVMGFKNKDELFIKLYVRHAIVSQSIKDKVVHDVMSIELQGWGHRVHTHVPSLALLDKKLA